jgi:dTDP-4-amino-4,6-dideoxygalactose transaminase
MEVPFIDLKTQYQRIKAEIDLAIQSVFESGQFIGGKPVLDFEASFASLLGVNHCVGVGNGTDAIFISLKSLGVTQGDEVITPAFGWISSAETITLASGKPVFADIEPEGFTLDPNLIESRITSKTKGVILVHLYGQSGYARHIKQICEKHGLFLIEDCAQAHLSEEFGAWAGTIGNAGTFSFYPTKNLGAYGDAGCIITSDEQIEKKARLYANHGGLHQHLMEGVNSRLDALQAAILSVKCRHLRTWTDLRIENANQYDKLLKPLQEIVRPAVRTGTRHTFHQYVVRVSRRNELKDYLSANGVQTLIHYPQALPNLPAFHYLKHEKEDFPIASEFQETVLSLPVHAELSQDQITYVCEKIRKFYEGK